jgi:plasmid stabilization system protein ParE
MARRKIIWSHRAKIRRYAILEFYIERDKSNLFAKKLNEQINKGIKLLSKYPNIGIKTDIDGVRGLILGNYVLFYEIDSDTVIIHHIWDSRQNPDELKIK